MNHSDSVSALDEMNLDKERYLELQHYCLQFPEWIKAMNELDRAGIQESAQRRIISRNLATVGRCAADAGPGWADALIANICYGVPLAQLEPAQLPTMNRAAYFRVRREFFRLLDLRRN